MKQSPQTAVIQGTGTAVGLPRGINQLPSGMESLAHYNCSVFTLGIWQGPGARVCVFSVALL